jgi:hypothetical protein
MAIAFNELILEAELRSKLKNYDATQGGTYPEH